MGIVTIDENVLTGIGNAIREKRNVEYTISPNDMAVEISDIFVGTRTSFRAFAHGSITFNSNQSSNYMLANAPDSLTNQLILPGESWRDIYYYVGFFIYDASDITGLNSRILFTISTPTTYPSSNVSRRNLTVRAYLTSSGTLNYGYSQNGSEILNSLGIVLPASSSYKYLSGREYKYFAWRY